MPTQERINLEVEGLQRFNANGKIYTGLSKEEIITNGINELTCVTFILDVTGSTIMKVTDEEGQIHQMRDLMVKALALNIERAGESDRGDNILFRIVLFSYDIGVFEMCGFVPASDLVMLETIPKLVASGGTNLNDAVGVSCEIANDYITRIYTPGMKINHNLNVMTDGQDTTFYIYDDENSRLEWSGGYGYTVENVRRAIHALESNPYVLESITTLFGIDAAKNSETFSKYLVDFRNNAGIENVLKFDATPEAWFEANEFVSNSIQISSNKIGGDAQKEIKDTYGDLSDDFQDLAEEFDADI